MTDYPERTNGETVWLGFTGRCPRCAKGKLFSRYLKVAESCENCGLDLRGHDAGDAAVVPAILLLGAILVGVALYIEFTYLPPVWVHVAIIGPLAIGLTMFMLPRLNGIAIALQHKYRSTEHETRPGGS